MKEQAAIEKSEGLKAQVLEGTSPVQSEKNLSKEETELLLSSTLDDRTREGRLEKTLSKMKEEFNLSSQSEDAIRKIGATKELSSDFFEKLQEVHKTCQERASTLHEINLKNQLSDGKLEDLPQRPLFLTIDEVTLLKSSTLDDRTREGRLEKTLSKMKEEFNLSSQSEDAIRKIATAKELSSDFFEKLQEVHKTCKERLSTLHEIDLKNQLSEGKLEDLPQRPLFLTIDEVTLLKSSTLDDRTREGRLEKTLSNFKTDFNLSDNAIEKITNIANNKGFSNDFFDKLHELTTVLKIESLTEKETSLRNDLEGKKVEEKCKELSDHHIDLLNSSLAFNPSQSNTIIQNYSKGVAFFESAEAFGGADTATENDIFEGGAKRLKKRFQQRNQQNKTNDISR